MLPVNEAGWDRALRIALGIAMLALGWSGWLPDVFALGFKLLGWVPLVTGTVGWCPLYAVLRISTKRSPFRSRSHGAPSSAGRRQG